MEPFVYLESYRVPVCRKCRFACVSDEVPTHLRVRHPEIGSTERHKVAGNIARMNFIYIYFKNSSSVIYTSFLLVITNDYPHGSRYPLTQIPSHTPHCTHHTPHIIIGLSVLNLGSEEVETTFKILEPMEKVQIHFLIYQSTVSNVI